MGKISKKKSGFYRFGKSIQLKAAKMKRRLRNSAAVSVSHVGVIEMKKQSDGTWRKNGKQ